MLPPCPAEVMNYNLWRGIQEKLRVSPFLMTKISPTSLRTGAQYSPCWFHNGISGQTGWRMRPETVSGNATADYGAG